MAFSFCLRLWNTLVWVQSRTCLSQHYIQKMATQQNCQLLRENKTPDKKTTTTGWPAVSSPLTHRYPFSRKLTSSSAVSGGVAMSLHSFRSFVFFHQCFFPFHFVKPSTIFSLGLLPPFLPPIFLAVTIFSSPPFLIRWPVNLDCLPSSEFIKAHFSLAFLRHS